MALAPIAAEDEEELRQLRDECERRRVPYLMADDADGLRGRLREIDVADAALRQLQEIKSVAGMIGYDTLSDAKSNCTAHEVLDGMCMVSKLASWLYPEVPMNADREQMFYADGGEFAAAI